MKIIHPADQSRKKLGVAVFAAGLTSITTQTVLLREFISVLHGNELVLGIALASWMILTGAGALFGPLAFRAANRIHISSTVLLVVSVLPPLTILLLDFAKNLVFPVGVMPDLAGSLLLTLLIPLPFCFLSGCLFTLFSGIFSEENHAGQISAVYSLEALGSFLGGLLFSLLFVSFFSTFQILFLLTLFDLGVCLFLSLFFGFRTLQIAVVAVAGILLVLNTQFNFDFIAKQSLFPRQEVLFQKDTPYGNIVVTTKDQQTNYFENGALLFVTNDPVSNEDAIHYAMVQHPNPHDVLLIGGGISGTTSEILKHGVEHLDYVEMNPALIEIGRQFTSSLNDPRISAVGIDGRRFLRNCAGHYSVAIINVPDPSTAQINRYYTGEFFGELKKNLASDGVVGLSLLESVEYMGDEARQLISVLHNTLKGHFKNVLIVPGLRNHILASDETLTTDIARAIAHRGLATVSVNENYIDDRLLGKRSDEILHAIDTTASRNTDFAPIAYYRQVQYWLSYFGIKTWIPLIIIVALLIPAVVRMNAVNVGIFTGGFAGASIEVILLLAFQVVYGFVYQAMGVIIALFMAGLAAGSFLGRSRIRRVDYRTYGLVQASLGLLSLVLPFILSSMGTSASSDILVYAGFILLTIAVSILAGIEFALATMLWRERPAAVASKLYGVDLMGSALGALLTSIFFLPLLGITYSGLIVGLLCAISSAAALVHTTQNATHLQFGGSRV